MTFNKPDKDGWVSYGFVITGKLYQQLGCMFIKPEWLTIKIDDNTERRKPNA